jgi:rare lipoprotein A
VRVTSVQSGKSVIVRITDRGPFHADRVIDLSYTAAYKLGLINGGSGLVDVEAIIPGEAMNTTYAQVAPPVSKPVDEVAQIAARTTTEDLAPKGIYLQLGAFANLDNAENLKNHLSRELDWVSETMRIQAAGNIHRLHLGPYASRGDAERVAERISSSLGYKPTFVTR